MKPRLMSAPLHCVARCVHVSPMPVTDVIVVAAASFSVNTTATYLCMHDARVRRGGGDGGTTPPPYSSSLPSPIAGDTTDAGETPEAIVTDCSSTTAARTAT